MRIWNLCQFYDDLSKPQTYICSKTIESFPNIAKPDVIICHIIKERYWHEPCTLRFYLFLFWPKLFSEAEARDRIIKIFLKPLGLDMDPQIYRLEDHV